MRRTSSTRLGFVNQSRPQGFAGICAADAGVDGEDIVVWHTFGSPFPRLEDWPVMRSTGAASP